MQTKWVVMEISVENLKFGSLYHFPNSACAVVDYGDPVLDKSSNGKTKTLHPKNPFVPLEIVAKNKNHNFLRIKVLLVDGTIWYMNTHPDDLRFLKEFSDDNAK